MTVSNISKPHMPFPRSIMFTSALEVERFQKSQRSGADVCLLDLEDSVPSDKKALARNLCAANLKNAGSGFLSAIRINELRSKEFLADMVTIIERGLRPDVVVVPMLRNHNEVEIVRALFAESNWNPRIFALIETPDGLENIDAIASRSDGLLFGAADFAAILGTQITWENMLYPRQKIAVAAARYGIVAIDTPCYDLSGPDLLIRECLGCKELGFHGKAAVHPSQVATIREIFTPSEAEVERAIAILAASEHSGGGIAKIDGKMIGPPFVKWAKKLLREVGRSGVPQPLLNMQQEGEVLFL